MDAELKQKQICKLNDSACKGDEKYDPYEIYFVKPKHISLLQADSE